AANETEASHIEAGGNTGVTVPAIRFSEFLAQQEQIDFLKMDIEGAEWEVIRDCSANLSKIKNLFLEYHGKVQDAERLSGLIAIVKAAGFSVYIKMAADLMQHPFVEKKLDLPYEVQLNLFCFKN
ncbi:MAG TPA: FkbM family methyltransferase, partial [Flavisolibacter sp.]|nr:FkbM family methyltransferase [Flavisolibacter sp.]